MKNWGTILVAAAALALVVSLTAHAGIGAFGDWRDAVRVETTGAHADFNGAALDGCPFISRDGKSFYMASTRPGGLGGIDIWVSTRASVDADWGAPVNVGAPVNSEANDFCPTLARDGHGFFFVSNRPGGCGGDDIYESRVDDGIWAPAVNVGCDEAGGPNSAANEASPFPLPNATVGPTLFFSSNRSGGLGGADVYMSRSRDGEFRRGVLVPGVNSSADDGQPNVRRDGLEIFFFSTRPSTLGLADLYSSTRASVTSAWSTPQNLGPHVNSADGAETRPSLSWDGTTLYFGSTRPGGEGSSDHYVTTRPKL